MGALSHSLINIINILKSYQFPNEEELQFLIEYYNNYSITRKNITKLPNRNNSDYLIALITGNKLKSFYEAKILVEDVKDIIDNLPDNEIYCRQFLNNMKLINNFGIEYLQPEHLKVPPFSEPRFLKFLVAIDNFNLMDYLMTFVQFKVEARRINGYHYSVRDKKINTFINFILKDEIMKELTTFSFDNIDRRIKELRKQKKDFEKKLSNQIQLYQRIYECLEKDCLIENLSLIDGLDEIVKETVLKAILLHNEIFYINATEQMSFFDNNIQGVLKLQGYDFTLLTQEEQIRLLRNGNIENIKAILPIIKKEPFLISIQDSYFVDILLCSSLSVLTNIENLFKREFFDINFLQKNKGILLSSSNKDKASHTCLYELFRQNIQILRNYKLNVKAIKNSNPQLLLFDTTLLNSILELFKKYRINLQCQDYTFISNPNIFKIIDSFKELGYDDYIKNNISLVAHNSEDIIKRVYITNMVTGKKNPIDETIIYGINYPVPQDNLDSFIINNRDNYLDTDIIDCFQGYAFEKSEIIETLDRYFLEEDYYLFDDIIISRYKVIRNISNYLQHSNIPEDNKITIILSAIIDNSILDDDQIKTILASIKKVFGGKKKML